MIIRSVEVLTLVENTFLLVLHPRKAQWMTGLFCLSLPSSLVVLYMSNMKSS
jgi:hypothetical protein